MEVADPPGEAKGPVYKFWWNNEKMISPNLTMSTDGLTVTSESSQGAARGTALIPLSGVTRFEIEVVTDHNQILAVGVCLPDEGTESIGNSDLPDSRLCWARR